VELLVPGRYICDMAEKETRETVGVWSHLLAGLLGTELMKMLSVCRTPFCRSRHDH
jgi:hypothetical protein